MGVAIASASVASCAKKASTQPSSAAPDDAAGMGGGADSETAMQAPSEDSIDELELRLLTYEEELLAAGVELPDQVQQARVKTGASVTAATAGNTDAADRCERICLLAANICDLRDRICELADEHDTEIRYQQTCERASLDCERVTPLCEDCDD